MSIDIPRRKKMSKLKNMSRAGYIIVGFVVALIVVPTGIAAAAVAYSGIEGTNGATATVNDAHVTSAGQLLTTEAAPSSFREYSVYVAPAAPSMSAPVCETVATVPTGDALVVQEVVADFNTASGTTTSDGFTTSDGGFGLFADTSTQTCSGGKQFISGEPTDGNVGSQSYPIVPGYVVPSHDTIFSTAPGLGGLIWVYGYLVPSADAPTLPEVAVQVHAGRP
jgi:hypothetical protein